MPCTKDESGEWNEYHVDLTGQDLADTFFMGFRFTSTRGRYNAATYYIDDVTYGRTDIAVIRPDVQELSFTAQPNKDAKSDVVTVATENLAEPIKLSLGGANKSKFKLSTTELDANGGSFSVTFNSDTEGVYSAYVKLSSRGAADKYVELTVNNTTATGISGIAEGSSETAPVRVHALDGTCLGTSTDRLPKGIYIVNGRKIVK